MLKITKPETQRPGGTIKLEGKLVGPWLDEVRSLVADTSITSHPNLDLSELTFADSAGVLWLRQLLHQGIVIESCSPFITELLQWSPSQPRP
jgi:hypothetical protein